MPDANNEKKLSTLVKDNQTHKCTPSCLTQVGKRRGVKKCRYGFPRSVQARTNLNTLEASVRSRVKGRKVKKIYTLARTSAETHINDYNPIILLLWEANMDIQYVGEKSMILNHYITSYVTKADRSATADLWDTICSQNSERSIVSNLKSLQMQALKQRECGAYEAVDLILGHSLMAMSESVIWLPARPKAERTRKFLSPNELAQLKENSTELFVNNLIDVYYPNRPEKLKDCCLYEVASCYTCHKGKMKEKFDEKTKKQQVFPFQICKAEGKIEDFYFQVRKECVVKCPVFSATGDQAEKHFFQMLLLFKPFQNEEIDLIQDCDTYREAFEQWYESLNEEELEAINKYRACRERAKKAVEGARTLREQAEAEETTAEDLADDEEDNEIETDLVRLPTYLRICTVQL